MFIIKWIRPLTCPLQKAYASHWYHNWSHDVTCHIGHLQVECTQITLIAPSHVASAATPSVAESTIRTFGRWLGQSWPATQPQMTKNEDLPKLMRIHESHERFDGSCVLFSFSAESCWVLQLPSQPTSSIWHRKQIEIWRVRSFSHVYKTYLCRQTARAPYFKS